MASRPGIIFVDEPLTKSCTCLVRSYGTNVERKKAELEAVALGSVKAFGWGSTVGRPRTLFTMKIKVEFDTRVL